MLNVWCRNNYILREKLFGQIETPHPKYTLSAYWDNKRFAHACLLYFALFTHELSTCPVSPVNAHFPEGLPERGAGEGLDTGNQPDLE